jgi:hypothetical protein
LCHVWTEPWKELSDVAAALVGCGHVSGLLMRQVRPLALMRFADSAVSRRSKAARFARADLSMIRYRKAGKTEAKTGWLEPRFVQWQRS